ncbi:uncharacterized protein LOC109851070 [Asparagus officinalis]|uniref:uncharacterized protein LOC109851070 n=1 Tax=Asparagus officinalis TaxID=4686 RepID=UPI00098E5729|nr:uncharacterized protein LOC109851070 [Asparagus officinalis]
MNAYASFTTDRDKMIYMVDDIDGLITDANRILQEKYNDVNDQPIYYKTPSADDGGLAKIAYKDLMTANEELKDIFDTRKELNTEVYSEELIVNTVQIFRYMRRIGLRVLKELRQYVRDDSPNDGNKDNETATKDIVREGQGSGSMIKSTITD